MIKAFDPSVSRRTFTMMGLMAWVPPLRTPRLSKSARIRAFQARQVRHSRGDFENRAGLAAVEHLRSRFAGSSIFSGVFCRMRLVS
jgi:hypothetical protein